MAERTSWKIVAEVLAERMAHQAVCEEHPRSASAFDCRRNAPQDLAEAKRPDHWCPLRRRPRTLERKDQR